MSLEKQPIHNTKCRKDARAAALKTQEERVTLSFYRYKQIPEPKALRDELFLNWSALKVLGRVYIAKEGINAQVSVPKDNVLKFKGAIESYFPAMTYREAVEEGAPSFSILAIKVKNKIVADGLEDFAFDSSDAGRHLSPQEWNDALGDKDTIVVDMRNHYESAVGHFEKAILPDADTFREELPMVRDMLAHKKEAKLLLYCTGGIRCEKASAYLKREGFADVNQLQGGIINYAHQVKELGLDCHYKGKNFVFDDRLGERITDDILTTCNICGTSCDDHTNCSNDVCHVLFIQCHKCQKELNGCCSKECKDFIALPHETQKTEAHSFRKQFKSRLRPKIRPTD